MLSVTFVVVAFHRSDKLSLLRCFRSIPRGIVRDKSYALETITFVSQFDYYFYSRANSWELYIYSDVCMPTTVLAKHGLHWGKDASRRLAKQIFPSWLSYLINSRFLTFLSRERDTRSWKAYAKKSTLGVRSVLILTVTASVRTVGGRERDTCIVLNVHTDVWNCLKIASVRYIL